MLVIYGSRVLFPRVELALDPVPNRDWTVSKRRRIFRIEKERTVRGSFSLKMEIIKRRLTSFNREATDESLVKTRECYALCESFSQEAENSKRTFSRSTNRNVFGSALKPATEFVPIRFIRAAETD